MNEKSDVLNCPFLLKPFGKDFIWGGNRLNDDFSKNINIYPLAETWECSTHPNGPSIVASGFFRGDELSYVLKKNPNFLGTHPKIINGQIPVLIKFIDANKDLSVQVHPSDVFAMEHENGSLGKTEMWYVVDASNDASIIYGFHHDISENQLRKSLVDGSIERYMNKVKVKKNDVFFIPAGTVHAIGRGCLMAEIQESSDLTYRLYDYKRIGKDGKRRELHVEKALSVANLSAMNTPIQPMRIIRFQPGKAIESLAMCEYFCVEKMIINTERIREMADFRTNSLSFQVLLCYSGCGVIFDNLSHESINFFKGDCIFVPANSVPLKIHGKAEFLKVRC